jgi:hypothetical protein
MAWLEFFGGLPDELVAIIFRKLVVQGDWASLCQSRQTCKRLHSFSASDECWPVDLPPQNLVMTPNICSVCSHGQVSQVPCLEWHHG